MKGEKQQKTIKQTKCILVTMRNSSSHKIICKTYLNSLLLQMRKQWLREVQSLNWPHNLQVEEPVIFKIPTLQMIGPHRLVFLGRCECCVVIAIAPAVPNKPHKYE